MRDVAISWKRNAARKPAPARLSVAAHCREIPCNRNENHRTRLTQTLASAGSAPRNPLHKKREQSYTTAPNTCPQGLPAVHEQSKYLPAGAPCRTRLFQNTCPQGLPAEPDRLSVAVRHPEYYLSVNFFLNSSA